MAFTSWAAIGELAAGEPKLLKRLAVRFSKPVLPGETMTTRFWTVGERDGKTVYAFESTNPAGDAVIKDGVAEIAI
jgi:acyl dehydratase